MDKVDAAEADFLSRALLQLEVVPYGNNSAELAGGLVARHDGREVKGRARFDPVRSRRGRRKGNPLLAGLYADRLRDVERELRAGNAENGARRIVATAFDLIGGENDAQRDVLRPPAGIVLHED